MASNLMIGFLVGAGFGAWIYSKMMHSTGGNTKNSLVVGATAGLIGLLLVTTLLSIFLKGN